MPGPSPAFMMTNLDAVEVEGSTEQSKSEPAKAAKEADQASDNLVGASQSAADYGKEIRDRVLGFIGDTAKGVVRPVLMPLQTIGRAGNTASMNALAKSLPGVVRKAVPPLKAEIEAALRKFHDLGDASELREELADGCHIPGGEQHLRLHDAAGESATDHPVVPEPGGVGGISPAQRI